MKIRSANLILFFACFMVPLISQAFAGGQIEPEGPPALAGQIVYTAWYEEQLINVAVANISANSHILTISAGTTDVGTSIYGSREIETSGNSIQIIKFPALKQKNVRGDLRISDRVFIDSNDPDASGLVASGTVQNIGQDNPTAFLEAYVVNSEAKARFNYEINADKSLRIVLIAKIIKGDTSSMTGKVERCWGKCKRDKDAEGIKKLNIPESYKKKIIRLMEDNFCFAVEPGKDATIAVEYKVPPIDRCEIVWIPVHTYDFTPSGGLLASGKGSKFMIYNSNWAKTETIKGDLKIHKNVIEDLSH